MPRPSAITGLMSPPKGYAFEPEKPLCARFTARSGFSAEGDRASITIFDYIGEGGFTDTRMNAALRAIGPTKPITVEINSPGGDYFQGVAIYNLLRRHEGEVAVQVLGIAASAASLIAMAGDRIEIARNAEIMIHNAWGLTIGNKHDQRKSADILDRLDKAMARTYAERTGRAAEEIAGWMDAETFFSGDEAVEMKFADAVMSDRDGEQLAYAAAPQSLREWDERLAMGKPLTRAERRQLFSQIRGMQDAAPPVTQDADLSSLAAKLRQLSEVFQ